MKKNCFKSVIGLALMVVGLVLPQKAMADQTPKYYTKTLTNANLVNSSDTNKKTVFLFNKATGLYLAAGGHWGTEGELKESGLPVSLSGTVSGGTVTGTTMYSTYVSASSTSNRSWGYLTSSTATSVGFYIDANRTTAGATNHGTFTFAPNTDGSYSIYTSPGTRYYLTQVADGTSRNNIVTASTYSGTIPSTARWYIVTLDDLYREFDDATASDAQPVLATFMIDNANFSREVSTEKWESDGKTSSNWTKYVRFGNSLFGGTSKTDGAPTTGMNINGSLNYNTTVETPEGEVKAQYGAQSANTTWATGGGVANDGSGYYVTDDDADYTDLASGSSIHYQYIYGGYYVARMLGSEGYLSQTIKPTRTGWYKISIDGYVYNPTATKANAIFYAGKKGVTEIGRNYREIALAENNTFENQTMAGITLANDANGEKNYRRELMVYLVQGEDFQFGVKLSGGVAGTARQSATSTIVTIDNFVLMYTGNADTQIVLNEEADNLEYLQKQTGEQARTLYLKRKMNPGTWNSLVLPVAVTAGSLKTAFGQNVKLCEYKEVRHNTLVYFGLVDLSNDASIAVQPGHCYIVKPSHITAAESGTYSNNDTYYPYSVEATPTSPVFTFNQVVLKEVPAVSFATGITTTDDGSMQFMGVYAKTDNAIVTGSYVIAGNTNNDVDNPYSAGNWYHWVGENPLSTKGFRCWLAPVEGGDSDDIPGSEAGEGEMAGALSFIIGDDYDPTVIKGVTEKEDTHLNGSVYNVNGQYMGKSANISVLPKGIYVVNGKKFIVK